MDEHSLEQMEFVAGGLKMPVGVALYLYGVALIELHVSTEPPAICEVIGFGASFL